jgi:molybdate transport system substrate-binding protein
MSWCRCLATTVLGLGIVGLVASCSNDDRGQAITVFAAASLTDAFNEIADDFEAANPDTEVVFNFAGSPTLVTQLEQGADADVLATADQQNMANAIEKNLVADEGRTFARNRLVIIVPEDNPGGVTAPRDLGNPGVKLVLAAPDVPVGRYARESLDKFAADATYGTDFSSEVLANLVSEEPNVKAVVTKIQLGEADAGIVYVTDVSADVSGDISQIEIADEFNVIASYPIAVTAEAGEPGPAQAFVSYILSAEGQATMEEFGFIAVQ